MQKFFSVILITLGFMVFLSGSVFAGETGHYSNGGEGIKASTLPPPGVYFRWYNYFYNADKVKDKNGDKQDIDFVVNVYAMVNRLIWVTDIKILGADYVNCLIIPLSNTDIKKGVTEDNNFGVGDIIIEPLILAWHKPRYDAAFGLGIFTPTGEYDKTEPASPGKDFWTTMITLGGTYYFDDNQTWSASILSRYEIHSEKNDTNVRAGNDFHFEWGIGKTLAKVWDVGLTGSCQWQVTDDSGSDVIWDKDVHDRVFAVGPEVSSFVPSARLIVSLRTQWEFGAIDRSEGNVTNLILTKTF